MISDISVSWRWQVSAADTAVAPSRPWLLAVASMPSQCCPGAHRALAPVAAMATVANTSAAAMDAAGAARLLGAWRLTPAIPWPFTRKDCWLGQLMRLGTLTKYPSAQEPLDTQRPPSSKDATLARFQGRLTVSPTTPWCDVRTARQRTRGTLRVGEGPRGALSLETFSLSCLQA